MNKNNLFTKRLILTLLIAVILLVFCSIVFKRATTGVITVESNQKDSTIGLLTEEEYKKVGIKEFSGKNTQKLVESIKPGEYVAVVRKDSSYSTKYISVKARQNQLIKVDLSKSLNPQPVFSRGAMGLSEQNNSLVFIDSASNLYTKINAQNKVFISPSPVAKRVSWSSGGPGLILSTSNELYIADGAGIRNIGLPFQAETNPSISFSVSQGGVVYVSNGQDVFRRTDSVLYKKVYSAGGGFISKMTASNNAVALIKKGEDSNSSIVVVDGASTKQITTNANDLSWSPDGRHIAATLPDKLGVIYSPNLVYSSTIPSFEPENYVWTKDGLVYSSAGFIWSYNLDGRFSQILTYYTSGYKIQSMNITPSGDELYYSQSNEENTGQISRIYLKSSGVSATQLLLGLFLPERVGVCSLDYITYGDKPTITVTYSDEQTTESGCINAARGEINSKGLDSAGFLFQPIRTSRTE